ncbi:MAG: radical SAM protein [Candidatus Schekmanbacteria bacterium]|nr:radical SAM protein [Candidatus Schekmanbacteria bacterium]
MSPSYLNLSEKEFTERHKTASALLEECVLCPFKCRTNRLSGQSGRCRCGVLPKVASFNTHHGEEPPISGSGGSGTIFFTNCNLRCCFCQNYPISQLGNGQEYSIADFANMLLALQAQGCHNINFVSPTPWTAQIIEGVKLAAQLGLKIPLVYNSSGYDSLEQLQLLDGMVDIYLPDMKYANAQIALNLSGAVDYPAINRIAIKEMQRQAGRLSMDDNGIAVKGLIIRHLVLPNHLAGSREILKFIAEEISPHTFISLMGQYFPAFKASENPHIARRINQEEYQEAIDCLSEFELDNGWVQEEYSPL